MGCEVVQQHPPNLAQNIECSLNMFLLCPLGTHDEPYAHLTIQIRARQKQFIVFSARAAALGQTVVELHV